MNSIFHQNKGNNDKGVVFVIQFNQVSKSYEDGTKAVDSLHLEIKRENFLFSLVRVVAGKQRQ